MLTHLLYIPPHYFFFTKYSPSLLKKGNQYFYFLKTLHLFLFNIFFIRKYNKILILLFIYIEKGFSQGSKQGCNYPHELFLVFQKF